MPVYTPDVEAEGFPGGARELKALFKAHQGFLIASPEYNGSVSGGLKNALDWASRPTDGEGPLDFAAFRGKIGGIMSASPGPLGGARGLQHLGQILATMHALVVTEQVMIPFGDKAIASNALYEGFPALLLPPLVLYLGWREALLAEAPAVLLLLVLLQIPRRRWDAEL